MSDDIHHTGRADIHHPKGPLTASPEPIIQEWEIEELGPHLPSQAKFKRKVAIFTEDGLVARDARVRAAVAEEIAVALDNAVNGIYIGVDKAVEVAREHAAAPSVRPDTDRTPDVGTSDAVGPHRCPSCDKPTQYQSMSGGREWYCPNCGNNGSYPDGVAPGRAGLLTTPEGREQLRAEVRDELARRAGSVPSLPEETPDAR